jgi:hypothetical protein
MAFSLISFMVGEVILIEKALVSPIDLKLFPEINPESFLDLKKKQFQILEEDSTAIELNEEESLLLYLLVDIVCRCFVSEANLFLEKRANDVMSIDKEEYKAVRLSYIHFAENLISDINHKFEKSTKFADARDRLSI